MEARTLKKLVDLHDRANHLIVAAGAAQAKKQVRRARQLYARAAEIEDRLSRQRSIKRRGVILVSAASCYVKAGDVARALDCLGRLCKLRPVARGQLYDIQEVARHIATIV